MKDQTDESKDALVARCLLLAALLVALAQMAFGVGAASAATFGKTAIGSASEAAGVGYKFGSVFRLAQAGTATSFSWYTRGGNAPQRLTPVVYRIDALGMPAALVVTGAEVQVNANQAPGWVTSTLPATSLAAGDYLLGLLAGPNGTAAPVYHDVVFNGGFWNANAYGMPSSSWGEIKRESSAYSFFVTYTPAGTAPTNSVPPAITGTPTSGQQLTASDGTWTGSPTNYARQWQRCDSAAAACANVPGATGSTYTLAGGDVGFTMRVVVTATNGAGSTQATSAASPVVAEAQSAPSNTAAPTISGAAVAGQTLTAAFGTWSGHPPPTLSSQWQVCQNGTCTDIAGASGTTYTVAGSDVGKTLQVVVTATNANGTARATSAPTATVTATPSATSGRFGADVPGSVGDQPGAGYKFGTIYRLTDAATLADFRFYARGGTQNQSFVPAIYSTSAGNPSTLITKGPAVTVAAGSAAGWRTSVLPSGVTLQPGDYMLALVPGPDAPGAYVYHDVGSSTAGWWNYNGYPNPSATWGAIRNSADRWAFHVNYETTATPAPPVNQTAPTISGAPYVGQSLTVTNGTWTNSPTSFDRQWMRCHDGTCAPISGATGASYVITADDLGSSLMVVVGATNGAGRSEAGSAPTAAVTAPPGSTIQPFTAFTIDGNPIGAVVEKTLADIDGDGRLDAVIGMESSPPQGGVGGIFWYRQPSSGNFADPWVKHTILPAGTAYEDMAPMDVNADGQMDIVASVDTRVWWFRNPGSAGGAWQQNLIGNGYRENTIKLGDLDGDGRRDVITNSAIFFQNGAYDWTTVPYNDTHAGVDLLDIGSGLGPVNLAANNGSSHVSIVWFENPRERGGNARTGAWTKRTIGTGYLCPGGTAECPEGAVATVATAEINGDGRVDVVTARSEDEPAPGGLRWYEAPVDRTGPWTKHDIQTEYESTHNLGVGDIDGNGAIDVVAGEQDQSPRRRLGVFYNDGNGSFIEQVLSTDASHNVALGDVEADGDVDILAGPHGYFGDPHPVQLFRNGRFAGGAAMGAGF